MRHLPWRDIPDASEAEASWARVVNRLHYQIVHQDPRNFLEWGTLGTMFVGNDPFVFPELDYLKQLPQWSERWKNAIVESNVGRPARFPAHPESSGNRIHHAYHLAQFEEKTGQRIAGSNFIFEFGGGYGSMCLLVHRLGFTGKYVIFDLAEFACLQSFYLKSMGLQFLDPNTFNPAGSGIVSTSSRPLLADILSRHRESNRVFIATWSISETSIPFRQDILSLVREFDAYLIAYQQSFGEVDNVDFFSRLKHEWEDIDWYDWDIPHIAGSRYLMGIRRRRS